MRTLLLAGTLAALIASSLTLLADPWPSFAQNVDDVVEIQVTTTSNSITLNLFRNAVHEVYRRVPGGPLGSPVVTLPSGTRTWTDTNVVPGVIYEYAVRNTNQPGGNAYVWGYVRAAIDYDQTNGRGTVILLIAENAADTLSFEVGRLITDLVADGWKVEPIVTPYLSGWNGRFVSAAIKEQIRTIYNQAGGEIAGLYILGHVPQPRMGPLVTTPDGHGSKGTIATDAYYADMDNLWRDTATYLNSYGDNYPNDGMWDGAFLPLSSISQANPANGPGVEFGYGRVDPEGTAGPLGLASDMEALRQFLNKNHRFRHADPTFLVGRRALLRQGNSDVQGLAMRDFHPIVAQDNIEFATTAQLPDPIAPNQNSDAQYSIENGPFILHARGSGGPNIDVGGKSVHWFGMQSHWGYWDSNLSMANQIMGDNFSQSIFWSTRIDYFIFPLGIGEPYTEAIRISANTHRLTGTYRSATTPYTQFSRIGIINLIGDPTLGIFQVDGVDNLTSTFSGNDVVLSWDAPDWAPDGAPPAGTELVGYSVYRSDDLLGNFTRIADRISGTTFTDFAPITGSNTYQVRAIYRITSGSGTFYQQAHGKFTTAGLKIETAHIPGFTIGQEVALQLAVTPGDAAPTPADGPYTWSVVSGSLPPGLNLLTTGLLRDYALLDGRYTCRIRVTNAAGDFAERDFAITTLSRNETRLYDYQLTESSANQIKDHGPYKYATTIHGNPAPDEDGGFVFDGVDDAVRIKSFASYPSLPKPSFGSSGTVEVWFKAQPGSSGGTILSRTVGVASGGDIDYRMLLHSNGNVQAVAGYRNGITSGKDYRDGEWHQIIWLLKGESYYFYVDGEYVSTAGKNTSPEFVDIFIGAHATSAAQTTLAGFFDGSIRRARFYSAPLSADEIKGIYALETGARLDVPVNPPILEPYGPIIVDEDSGPHQFELNFADLDGDVVTAYISSDDSSNFEYLELEGSGNTRYLVFNLEPNVYGEFSVLLTYTDGWVGHEQQEEITITVNSVPDPPTAVDDRMRGTVNTTVLLDVLKNDFDVEGKDFSLVSVTQPDHGTATVAGDKISYTPPQDWTGEATFQYAIENENDLIGTGVVTVFIFSAEQLQPLVELRMNESGATTVAPNTGSLGSAANGIISGSPHWVAGRSGNALQLNGTNHVNLGNSPSLNFNPAVDDFVISFAFKPDYTNIPFYERRTLLSKSTGAQGENAQFSFEVYNVGIIYYQVYAGGAPGAFPYNASPVPADLWQHFMMVNKAGENTRFYLNGQLVRTVDASPAMNQGLNGADLLIGASLDSGGSGTTNHIQAAFDSVVIFDHIPNPLILKSLFEEVGFDSNLPPEINSISIVDGSTVAVDVPTQFIAHVWDLESDPLTYTWTSEGRFNGSANNPTASITFAEMGEREVDVTVADPYASTRLTETFLVGEAYGHWSEGISWPNPGVDDLPLSDPDFDGIPNIVEYYMNIDPLTPQPNRAWESGMTTGDLVEGNDEYIYLKYRRYKGAHGVEASLQMSETLSADDWQNVIGIEEEPVPEESDADTDVVIVKVPVGVAESLFLRLQVEAIE